MIILYFPAKNSYKRTVKKYEGIRYRKSESKRRNERKTSQGIF
jgi:hypothetical protein